MYSCEDRMTAVPLYIGFDHQVSGVIKKLGYASRRALRDWYKEFPAAPRRRVARQRIDFVDLREKPRPGPLTCVHGDLRAVIERLEARVLRIRSLWPCDSRQPSGARAATRGIWDEHPLVRDECSSATGGTAGRNTKCFCTEYRTV